MEAIERIKNSLDMYEELKNTVSLNRNQSESFNFAILATLVEILEELKIINNKNIKPLEELTKAELVEMLDSKDGDKLLKLKKEELIEKVQNKEA